ncbi:MULTISPECIES: MFS transporter [Bacillus]|uniref:MFS transporter n=1 Tax=Bacillus TaxID=1386 RepID=UPI000BB7AA7C|nr:MULTISPECIES: MFS transporter [Bacillus]
MNLKWIMISQSVVLFGTGIVFPFYILFLKEIGANFSEFGIAYGLFTLSAAFVHKWIGKMSDRFGRRIFLIINAWGTALLFLFFPIVTNIWQVYTLQVILGIIGAMQKTSEKAIIADVTDGRARGEMIGSYHFWVSIFSGIAVIISGFIIDFLTIDLIFYLGSIILFISGWITLRIEERSSTSNKIEKGINL